MTKTIIIQPEGLITSEPLSIIEVTDMILTNLLGTAKVVTDAIEDEDERGEFAFGLYDFFNDLFTQFLEEYIPDAELRPDLTAEAILKIENELLKEKEEGI